MPMMTGGRLSFAAVCGFLLCCLLASSVTVHSFILQELPLYRSTRDSEPAALMDIAPGEEAAEGPVPLAAALQDGRSALFFARPARAFNFQRMNRLRNYWNRNEALRRMAQSTAWKPQSADK